MVSCSFIEVSAAEIKVFAAVSLADALNEISSNYQKGTGDHIVVNLGASSTLARQIEAGAPADIFFSADEIQMNELIAKGLIVNKTRKSLLSNSLVIVASAETALKIRSPRDLAGPQVKRIALGDPRAVPIGVYSKEYLKRIGLWERVAGKIVPTENVRAALAAVEAGNADVTIVYKTDAAVSKKNKIVFEVPRDETPKIIYPVAMIEGSPHREAAQKFLNYLAAEQAAKLFAGYGFIVLRGSK
jgi:molybdate transport system substrate-binding protein